MATTTDFDRARLTSAPRVRSLRLGELKITFVPDGLCLCKPRGWLTGTAEERRRLVEELSRPGTIGYGNHFADVVFGRAERRPDGRFTWLPVA
ncbi:hypothetical protein [Microbispora rosea]|uniref:hypothetical protein n=1 Tax=Microbispora rosea TaxID=58117 RepID=UPI003D926846